MRFHWERLVVFILFVPTMLAMVFIQLAFVLLFYDDPHEATPWTVGLRNWADEIDARRRKRV